MYVIMIILGILMILLGVACIFTPVATLAATGVFIAIVLIASGITGILTGFEFKRYGINFIVSILALILGILALVRPGGIQTIDNIILYLFSAWLIIRGGTSVALSLNARKLYLGNDWIWGLIIGILGIVLGIYSFVHPAVSAIAVGLLIAFYLIEEGIDIIAMSRVMKELSDAAE